MQLIAAMPVVPDVATEAVADVVRLSDDVEEVESMLLDVAGLVVELVAKLE